MVGTNWEGRKRAKHNEYILYEISLFSIKERENSIFHFVQLFSTGLQRVFMRKFGSMPRKKTAHIGGGEAG